MIHVVSALIVLGNRLKVIAMKLKPMKCGRRECDNPIGTIENDERILIGTVSINERCDLVCLKCGYRTRFKPRVAETIKLRKGETN